jgi:hypothetical protein
MIVLRNLSIALYLAVELSMTSLGVAQVSDRQNEGLKDFIRQCAVSRHTIDDFLRGPGWAKFDPELGYIQRNYVRHDGMSHS